MPRPLCRRNPIMLPECMKPPPPSMHNSTGHQGDRQSGEHAGIIFVWPTCHCYDHLGREHSNSYEPAGKATLLSYCTSPGAGTTSQRASMAYFVGTKNYFPPRKILQGLHRIISVWPTGHCYVHLGREHSNSYKPAGKATLLSFVLHLELEELNPD